MQINARSVGNVKILDLSGTFDAYTAPQIRQWLEQATEEGPACIVVNLQEVSFLDSTALSTLVLGLKRARHWQGDLRLCCLQQTARIIFELTRLDRVFEIYNSETDALRAFTDYVDAPSMDDAISKVRLSNPD